MAESQAEHSFLLAPPMQLSGPALFVGQGEAAVACSDAVGSMYSTEATTCIIVAARSSESGLTALAHLDSAAHAAEHLQLLTEVRLCLEPARRDCMHF